MPSGADLIQRAKQGLELLDPSEARAELSRNGTVLLDVREQHEFEERHIEDAIHVPRGHLETRIEQFLPDRERRVIVYC
jgi:rhodanese-related sulfurtransferase